jgi:Cyclic nucleotide-binding domain
MLPFIFKTALIETSLFDCPFIKDLTGTIKRPYPLSPDCKRAFMECVTPQTLEAQEVLLEAGQLSDRLYWIETGLVRFFSDADVTTGFCSEGDFFCAISSIFSQKPSTESICAEETTVLRSISSADLQRLFALYPELSHAFCILYGHLLKVTLLLLHWLNIKYLHLRPMLTMFDLLLLLNIEPYGPEMGKHVTVK